MDMLLAYLKRPSTYVLIVLGVILAFAYGSFLAVLRPVAKVLPKSQA